MELAEFSLAEEYGYRIVTNPDGTGLTFIDLQTRGPSIFAWISGGVAVLLGVLAGVQFVMLARGGAQLPPASPILLSLLALLAAWGCWRGLARYRSRQTGPGKRLVLAKGQLTDGQGHRLAAGSAITVRVAIDWTDGTGGLRLARLLVLRWPGGQATLYKTFDKNQLATVRAALAQALAS